MNGSAFRVRHKEWAVEAAHLAFKALPWMFIFTLPIFLVMGSIMTMLPDNLADYNIAIAVAIAVASGIVYGVHLLNLVGSPAIHIFFVILHRIDFGKKVGPFAIAWYICDKVMWQDHMREILEKYKFAIILMVSLNIGFALQSIFSTAPTPPPASTALEMTKLFWAEHPILKTIYWYMHAIISGSIIYLAYMCYIAKFKFNIFMQANGYKPHKLCVSEAKSASTELSIMHRYYVTLPLIFLMLIQIGSAGIYDKPMGLFLVNSISTVMIIWIVMMNYIIGRDYYIGPPKKKQEQEDFDASHATA